MTESKRAQWDFGRFFQTLTFFEVLPFCSWIKLLTQGKSQNNQAPVEVSGVDKVGIILVAGATGGVGKRVVKQLHKDSIPVRCLVRDIDRARAVLGDEVDLVAGDITKPETLNPLVMTNVKAVICATAVRVQPVEGDTVDRAKYNQGVKFFQPEIVGDTPENVEYGGVKNLVEAAAKYLPKSIDKIIFDFTQPSTELQNLWGAVDDVVMGGVSESNIKLVDNTALFTGNVSTANSGGFASVRTKNFTEPLDLSAYEGIDLRIKGDGKRYKFLMRTESKWDGPAYSYSFNTVPNIWTTIRIPFADMIAVFRAKTVKDSPAINQSEICSLQLMLSKFEYDGELNPNFSPGSFSLQLESIKTYGGKLPQFVLVSSAGVTRPGRPGINLDEEPPAVKLNDQLGGILTWKLKGEDSLRESGISYTIIRPCALTEETGGKEYICEQGDNIKGKISRNDIATLCVEALKQTNACNITFEVKEGEKKLDNSDFQELFAQLKPDAKLVNQSF
ncbi:MAG: CIA30 family protein [Cyanobacteria bacterium P01_A01_bin.45]